MENLAKLLVASNQLAVGEKIFFDAEVLPKDGNFAGLWGWKSVVRTLESEGKVTAAITKNFPEGVFCADGLTADGFLKGWGLENEIPEKIVVKNIGWAFLSKKPEAPKTNEQGLKLVPHHTMAVILGSRKNGWGKVEYIPSGGFSMMLADTAGIQYGQSAFEGACAMRGEKNEIFGFRLDQNAHRFLESIASLDLPTPNEDEIREAIEKTIAFNSAYVPENGTGKLYIRPSVSGLSGGLGIIVPDFFLITVEVAAFGDYLPFSIRIEGRKDICRPSTGTNKIAPNYGASFKIKHGVKERGYNDYLSFDTEGNVEEVATCAVGFLDTDGNFVFPPVRNEIDQKTRNILPSITRKSVMEILRKTEKNVVVRDVHFSELSQMQGMFTMGNAVGVLFVSEICLKENENDAGATIVYDPEKVVCVIEELKNQLFSARVGTLNGFESWAKKLG